MIPDLLVLPITSRKAVAPPLRRFCTISPFLISRPKIEATSAAASQKLQPTPQQEEKGGRVTACHRLCSRLAIP